MKGMKLAATLSLGVITLSMLFASCKKEKETIATITVKGANNQVVSGAQVRLFAVGSPDVEQINEIRFDTLGTTNASGKVSFNFSDYYKAGQAGFAVLDIQASKGTLYGTGIIKIEEETTSEETVIVE